MPIDIRLLRAGDAGVLSNVAPGVFDGPVEEKWTGLED